MSRRSIRCKCCGISMKKRNPNIVRLRMGALCPDCYVIWLENGVKEIRERYIHIIEYVSKEMDRAIQLNYKDWVQRQHEKACYGCHAGSFPDCKKHTVCAFQSIRRVD